MLYPQLMNDVLKDAAVSERDRYAYLPVGKAANTNVKRWLWQIEHEAGHCGAVPEHYFGVHNYRWALKEGRPDSPWHLTPRNDFETFLNVIAGKVVLTMVRNPYARLLSGFRDKVLRRAEGDNNTPERMSLPYWPETFEEFARIVCEQDDTEADIHFRSQSLSVLFEFLHIDVVARLETAADDLAPFTDAVFGRPVPALSGAAAHKSGADEALVASYTPELQRLVAARFADDFERFGYDPGRLDPAPVRPVATTGARAGEALSLGRIVGAFAAPKVDPVPPAALREAWRHVRERASVASSDPARAFALVCALDLLVRAGWPLPDDAAAYAARFATLPMKAFDKARVKMSHRLKTALPPQLAVAPAKIQAAVGE